MKEMAYFLSTDITVQRWNAERENATARIELARMKACMRLLISQHDPVAALGMDRKRLEVILSFVQHGDSARLRRDCEALLFTAAPE